MEKQWNHKVFGVKKGQFEDLALEIFHNQAVHNPVYAAFLGARRITPSSVVSLATIPFLPISLWKNYKVLAGNDEAPILFESSGTTGSVNSRHYVTDISLYEESFLKAFTLFYGDPAAWCIIGLLPSYLERGNSSLVYMVNDLITKSKHPSSGFYLHELDQLAVMLQKLEHTGQKTLLIGVTYALLDFAARFPMTFTHTIVMETGGMKGRRKEMVREEVHAQLMQAFGLSAIHSEYGMTELLSQAYSRGNGIFTCPPWMQVWLREEDDPLDIRTDARRQTGLINIIDLANVHSCSFIATDDVGRLHADGSFEVLGRMDNSDIRGCSLMVM